MPNTPLNAPDIALQLQGLAQSIATAQDTGQLCALLWQLKDAVRADGAVFLFRSQDQDRLLVYQYLLACPLSWSQTYDQNRWHSNDPCLQYAMVNSQARLMSDLRFRSPGQRRLRLSALRAGYQNGVVVPVHSPEGRKRMGVLFLLSSHPDRFNHDHLARTGWLLQGLAGQLLNWWIEEERRLWRNRLVLQAIDLELLRLTHAGFASKDIARLLHRSKASIDQRLYRTTRQFATHSRKIAAQMAYQLGLL